MIGFRIVTFVLTLIVAITCFARPHGLARPRPPKLQNHSISSKHIKTNKNKETENFNELENKTIVQQPLLPPFWFYIPPFWVPRNAEDKSLLEEKKIISNVLFKTDEEDTPVSEHLLKEQQEEITVKKQIKTEK